MLMANWVVKGTNCGIHSCGIHMFLMVGNFDKLVTSSLLFNKSLKIPNCFYIILNNCGHRNCLCYIINFFSMTSTVKNILKLTFSSSVWVFITDNDANTYLHVNIMNVFPTIKNTYFEVNMVKLSIRGVGNVNAWLRLFTIFCSHYFKITKGGQVSQMFHC